MIRRVWCLAGLLTMLLVLVPSVALAHAELVRSEPSDGSVLTQAPTKVRLFFSEPIEPDFFALEVYAQDRKRVDRGDAHVPVDDVAGLEASLGDLQPGTYTVAWRVLSIDSHVVRGTFVFSVGTSAGPSATAIDIPAGGAPFELDAAVRWATFLLSFVLAGAFAFLPLIFWPALRKTGIAHSATSSAAERRLLTVAWITLIGLLVVSLAALLVQAANATGLSLGDVFAGRAISRLLLDTKYGVLWMGRIGCLFGLLVVIAAGSARARVGSVLAWLGVALSALLLLAISATGHASAVARQTSITIVADWMHMIAGAIWTGGLVQLITTLPAALGAAEPERRRILLARTVQRFSWVAGISVAVLIVTGTYAGLIHVPTLQSMAYTAYGAALSGKLILIVPLLALGAANLLILHPRFVRNASRGIPPTDAGDRRLFRALVSGELLFILLVLAVTGILTGLPPATLAPGAGQPFSATQTVGDLRVTLSTTPNQTGTNRIEAQVLDAQGQPVELPQVTLKLTHRDMAMDPRTIVLSPAGGGRYTAEGNTLNMAGPWEGELSLGTGAAPASTTFDFTVGDPQSSIPTFSPALILAYAFTPRAGLGVLALILAAVVFVKRSGWQRLRDRRQAVWVGAGLLVLGLLATGSTLATAYRRTLPNLVPATAETIAQGRQLYIKNCAACHGVTGRGDGPAGVRLNPRPADFRVHMAAGHTDQQLFDWVTNGVDGTGMPAFKEQLSEQEIWTVINFIRTFASKGP